MNNLNKEFMEMIRELIKELKIFNKNMDIINKGNKKVQTTGKKDPFEVIVPKNFWKDILNQDLEVNNNY